jgi:hypothetical protein
MELLAVSCQAENMAVAHFQMLFVALTMLTAVPVDTPVM